jgi:hypothetical protein
MWPDANIGLAIPENYVVVDVDVDDASTVLNGHPLPPTTSARTGRGWHYLYRTDATIRPRVSALPHVDLRGPGSYIVAQPSRHISGAPYEWLVPLADVAWAPAWISELARHRPEAPRSADAQIPDGQRNATLASLAGAMRRRGLSAAAIEAALLVTNRDRCRPPLTEDEVHRIAASIGRYPPESGDRSSANTGPAAPDTRSGDTGSERPADPDEVIDRDIAGMDAAREELRLLPDKFWCARAELQHIRQAAQARLSAPDAVLGGVLAHLAARVPYGLGLPPIVGSEAGLALLVSLVSPPGLGKTNGIGVAGELLPRDPHLYIVPSGSGEGIAETFYDTVLETDAHGKERSVRKVARHNTLVVADEGQKATRQGSRQGSTLFAVWRTAFMGGLLGEQNADIDRRRLVAAGQYSIGLLVAFQPEILATLFDDLAAGTPQRFIYLAAQDPTLPDDPPDWPGQLAWQPPELRGRAIAEAVRPQHIVVAASVAAEIRRDHLARQRGRTPIDHWSAHRNLIRLKVAALLGILAGRVNVSEEDWDLAHMIIVASEHVRAAAQAAIGREVRRVEAQGNARSARRRVEEVVAVDTHHVVDTARALTAIVRVSPGAYSPSDAKREMRRRREFFRDGLEYAVAQRWLDQRTEPGRGHSRVRLYPGPTRP